MTHQGSQTGTGGIAQKLQTPGNKYPVFSLQRHDISHSTQADHVRILLQDLLLVAAEGGCQLKGNANTGKGLMGVTAVGTVRIHNGNSLGQNILALMVVGDYQIHTQFFTKLRFGNGSDAAVHSDDQLDALLSQCMQRNGIQAIALFQPAGDIGHTIGAVFAQKVCK